MFLRYFFIFLLSFSSFSFAKELTLVLSATSEIGQDLLQLLAEKGEDVLLLARDKNKLEKLSQDYAFPSINLDLEEPASFSKLSTYLEEENAKLKGFVLITPRPSFKEALPSEAEWLAMFRTCYTRPLELLKLALPYFKPGSQLLVLSGLSSVQVIADHASYGVLRKMWLAEAKSLSLELGAKGIAVNSVSPGAVVSSTHLKKWRLEAKREGISFDEFIEKKKKNYPLAKLTSCRDVAEAIYFFLEAKSNITGQNLIVDGGFSKVY